MKILTNIREIKPALILEISKLVSREMSSGNKIINTLSLLSRWANLHYGRIMLPNYQDSNLEVAYHYGLKDEFVKIGKYTVPFDQGMTGYVWRSNQSAVVTDAANENIFLQRIIEPIDQSINQIGFIAVPINFDGKTLGVLSVQRRANPRRPYSDDVDLLRVITALIAPVLQNVHHGTQQISYLPTQLDHKSDHFFRICEANGIAGSSRPLLFAVKEIVQVKDSDAPIMLLGESGTGKEMFARLAHNESIRRDKPLISINCASIPAALLESELFGHEKGSFTGAHRRQVGKIEQAQGGTLFLDEIGDMPLDLQSKLLRVLQDKTIQPIGSDVARRVDFRLITATHVNLANSIRDGKFRLDLYYRINVIPINLPPLRKRGQDIPILSQFFLKHFNELYDRKIFFTQGVFEKLQEFHWPGNIRQLQNLIERAVLKSDGNVIGTEDIDEIINAENIMTEGFNPEWNTDGNFGNISSNLDLKSSDINFKTGRGYLKVSDCQIDSIQAALDKAQGNQAQAARLLGMTARQLRYRLLKLGIIS
ncbi:MAG: sigma-54-dependent Fis family transcriptional regulator [Halothiobacillus sp.]